MIRDSGLLFWATLSVYCSTLSNKLLKQVPISPYLQKISILRVSYSRNTDATGSSSKEAHENTHFTRRTTFSCSHVQGLGKAGSGGSADPRKIWRRSEIAYVLCLNKGINHLHL